MTGAERSARRVAFDVLEAVRASDAYANLLLPQRIARAGLNGQDAAFATELCYGALRGLGYYDAVVALLSSRPLERIDPAVLDVLRLGLHQLLGARVPPHAAVDETVSLARAVAGRSTTGFVNGILRTAAREGRERLRERVLASARDEDERLALEHSHPRWIVAALRGALARHGRADEIADLLAADNLPPRVTAVALPGLAERADLCEPTALSPLGAVLAAGRPDAVPAIAAGRARVQDEGSQLAALALSRARPVVAGERWLDLCAGPGGKAALLGAEAARGGASLVANELVPARAGLVERAVATIEPRPVVRTGDGRDVGAREPAAYDRVLLDAPCTGLGALRRRPESRWRRTPEDVPALVALQRELLASAAAAVRPGGLVAYITCSPLPEETLGVVADAPALGLAPVDTAAMLDALTGAALGTPGEHCVQLWPHAHGTDAMFVQLLERA